MLKTKRCIQCGEPVRQSRKKLCNKCLKEKETEQLRKTNNPLCDSCKKRCKQNMLVEVVKCPTYVPKDKKDSRWSK